MSGARGAHRFGRTEASGEDASVGGFRVGHGGLIRQDLQDAPVGLR
jgi:hypothetical protein